MKIYEVNWYFESYLQHAWFANKAEADKKANEVRSQKCYGTPQIRAHDIPTDKKGVLRWLNAYARGADV
jgi:hypothetical protein